MGLGSQSCVPLSRLTLRLGRGTEGSRLALWDPGGALIPNGPVLWVETQATHLGKSSASSSMPGCDWDEGMGG